MANRPELPEGYEWMSCRAADCSTWFPEIICAVKQQEEGWQATLCGSTGAGDPFSRSNNRGKTKLCSDCLRALEERKGETR